MEYYGINDYRDYLAHHGVLGMHWGIRRYQPYGVGYQREGGVGGKEVGEARGTKRTKDGKSVKTTGLRKRIGIRIQARGQKKARNFMNFRSAKGFNRKASALIGNKRHESEASINSRKESQLADASKTRFWKRVHETRSANSAHMAGYYAAKQKQTVGQRVFEKAIINKTYIKTPYQRLSGRTTTRGREILNQALTGGMAGLVLDAKYMRAKSKTPEARAAKIARKEQKYQNKINKINSKSDAYLGKLNSKRSKNRSKIEAGYDKKIAKATDKTTRAALNSEKRAKLKDFDTGTRYINKAGKNVASDRTGYLEMKRRAVSDRSVKNTAEYKEARKKARNREFSDTYFGKGYTLLNEAGRVAREDLEKKKKKNS